MFKRLKDKPQPPPQKKKKRSRDKNEEVFQTAASKSLRRSFRSSMAWSGLAYGA